MWMVESIGVKMPRGADEPGGAARCQRAEKTASILDHVRAPSNSKALSSRGSVAQQASTAQIAGSFSLPRTGRQVLGADLKRSESGGRP
jgi:hypothetical protein